MPVGKKVILRAIPYWRKWGTEKWVVDEEARYTCPECDHKIFRGAKRCNRCKSAFDID
jgi:DNA-directed RNA polymerase subunit RPC12/RpoP